MLHKYILWYDGRIVIPKPLNAGVLTASTFGSGCLACALQGSLWPSHTWLSRASEVRRWWGCNAHTHLAECQRIQSLFLKIKKIRAVPSDAHSLLCLLAQGPRDGAGDWVRLSLFDSDGIGLSPWPWVHTLYGIGYSSTWAARISLGARGWLWGGNSELTASGFPVREFQPLSYLQSLRVVFFVPFPHFFTVSICHF